MMGDAPFPGFPWFFVYRWTYGTSTTDTTVSPWVLVPTSPLTQDERMWDDELGEDA